MTLDLSIVVPARQEAARLPDTIDRLLRFLDARGTGELILAVDQASEDGTVAIAQEAEQRDTRVRHTPVHSRGKGHAVIAGAGSATGRVVLIADADLSVDPSQFESLVEPASRGALAIATRNAPGAERLDEPITRFLLGRLFNLVTRSIVLPGVRDSQCGFKAFPREEGLALLRSVRSGGWAFDVEFLAQARRNGLRIREVPVRWRYGHESTLRPLRDAAGIVRELWDIRRRLGRVNATAHDRLADRRR